MAIQSIYRDWGNDAPSIVRIQSTDSLATVSGLGYITAQAANIQAANNGKFDWLSTDTVLVTASDGWAHFSVSADFASLNAIPGSLSSSVAITAAQFNGMYAAPILLIPAPGANRLIIMSRVVLIMTYNSAAYAAGGVVAAQYDSTINGAGTLATSTQTAASFQATASTSFMLAATLGTSGAAFSTTVNKGIYLSNVTGAFTTGNSPFVAKLFYQIVPTA